MMFIGYRMWGKVLGGFFLGLVAVRGQERAGSVLLVHERTNNLVHTPKVTTRAPCMCAFLILDITPRYRITP